MFPVAFSEAAAGDAAAETRVLPGCITPLWSGGRGQIHECPTERERDPCPVSLCVKSPQTGYDNRPEIAIIILSHVMVLDGWVVLAQGLPCSSQNMVGAGVIVEGPHSHGQQMMLAVGQGFLTTWRLGSQVEYLRGRQK